MGRPGWERWAEEKGLKWSSVQNVLRDLEKAEATFRIKEQQADPLNAARDAAGLPSGVFHTK